MGTIASINQKPFNFNAKHFKKQQDGAIVDEESHQVETNETPSMRQFLMQRPIQINLAIMCGVWLITSFNYYLI